MQPGCRSKLLVPRCRKVEMGQPSARLDIVAELNWKKTEETVIADHGPCLGIVFDCRAQHGSGRGFPHALALLNLRAMHPRTGQEAEARCAAWNS